MIHGACNYRWRLKLEVGIDYTWAGRKGYFLSFAGRVNFRPPLGGSWRPENVDARRREENLIVGGL